METDRSDAGGRGAEVEALLAQRSALKRARKYEKADQLRELLGAEYDVSIDDARMSWSVGGRDRPAEPATASAGGGKGRGGKSLMDKAVEKKQQLKRKRESMLSQQHLQKELSSIPVGSKRLAALKHGGRAQTLLAPSSDDVRALIL